MSMISKQVKELREMADYWKSNGLEPQNALRKAADTIEALSEKLAAKNNNGWIPCNERLPEVNRKSYLVTYRTSKGKYYVKELYYRYAGVWEGRYNGDVIAWQPLPEPYTQGNA